MYADFRHRMPLRVRWAEVDKQAVVFNAHYLLYCDVCVTEYWRAIGMHYPDDFAAQGTIGSAQVDCRDHSALLRRRARDLRPHGTAGNGSMSFIVEIYRRRS